VVWNVMFMGLAAEATVMLYDGSPFARDAMMLFDYAQKERITHFGTSAKFLDALSKRGVRPADAHDLPGLRMIISTGSPLAPESFDYVYAAVKKDVCLASISGGTDIMGAFVDASAVLPCIGESCNAALSAWRSKCSTRMENRSSARRASWCAPGRSLRCRSVSGTIPAGSATTTPTSPSIRTSGATATGASSPSAAR
jgi:acyl-coenzyme A synthetase/AMP-(fatty) acid ligase